MRLELGPLPSSAVSAWLGYAFSVVGDGDVSNLPADVVEHFARFLGEWQAIAEANDEFHWAAEMPNDLAEYLTLAFYRLAQRLADRAERTGSRFAPEGTDEFYGMLVHRLLEALAAEGGPSGAAFSQHLLAFWPGLEDLP